MRKKISIPFIFIFMFAFMFNQHVFAETFKAQAKSITVGETVVGQASTIKTTATSTNQPLYEYHLGDRKTGEWKILKNYSTSSSYSWIPQKEGTYRIVVHVKDSKSTASYDSYVFKEVTVTSSFKKALATSVTVGAPLVVGSSTIVKATASSTNQALYEYHLGDKTTDTWTVLKGYSTSPSYTWVPKKAGTYRVVVHVKDSKSTASYDSYVFKDVTVTASDLALAKSLNVNEKAYIGYSETIEGNAESTSTVLYKFFLNNRETGEWITLQDFMSNSKITFTPEQTGNFRLVMHVKNINSSKTYDSYLYKDISVKNLSKAVISSFNASSKMFLNPGNTISASAQSDNQALYKYIVQKPDQTWETIQDFSPKATITWKPSAIGNYRIVLHVKDSYSKNTYDNYTFQDVVVTELPEADYVDFSTDRPFFANQPTVITHQSETGTVAQYKTVVRNQVTGEETILQNFDNKQVISWVPQQTGSYLISVYVKDQLSSKAYDDFYQKEVTVGTISKATLSSFSMLGTNFYIDKSYTISANASSVNGAMYKFFLKDNTTGAWTTLQDYSLTSSISWVPKYKGNFRIVVHVKDRYSDATYDAYTSKDIKVTGRPTKIVIDAGHGGTDPGAIGATGSHEGDVTLDISKRVVAILNKKEGFTAIESRPTDKFVTLQDRVAFANSNNADLFMSIHMNTSTSTTAGGTETYIYYNADPTFGKIVHKHLIAATGLRDRGVKEAGFYVIKNTRMPATLVEVAFLSNPDEEKLAKTSAFKDKVANALADALVEYSKIR